MPTPAIGDIAIIEYSADTAAASGGNAVAKSFSFVVLADNLGGTVLTYSDNGWLAAGGFRQPSEGYGNFTIPVGTVAGTVFTISGLTGNVNPSTSGDQFSIFTGGSFSGQTYTGTPSFLFAVDFADNNATWAGDATSTNTSAVPTGLQAIAGGGGTAMAFAADNASYTGITTGTKADLLAAIENPANWTQNDANAINFASSFTVLSGGQATSHVSINDVSIAEGDSGDTVLTFTVTRTDTTGAFTVDYATHDGTATTADNDYVAKSGTLTFTAGGAATQTVQITIHGDTTPENNEAFTVGLSNLQVSQGLADISDNSGTGTINNDDIQHLEIWQIQGASHTSPYVNQQVITTGIVTAIDKDGNAYWLQTEDANADSDTSTSNAIYVFNGAQLNGSVAVGDKVSVQGVVNEFRSTSATTDLTLTEINSPTTTVLSHGNALPTAVLIGTGPGAIQPPLANIGAAAGTFDPVHDGLDFWESLEGMRVTLQDTHATSAFYSSFGEIYVTPNVGDTTSDNPRGVVVSGDPNPAITQPAGKAYDFNPQVIQLDDEAGSGVLPHVGTGDQLGDITGIVHYANSEYEVDPTSAVSVVTPSTIQKETTTIVSNLDSITVAGMNVQNLAPVGFANGESQPSSQAKFDAIAQAIIHNMGSPTIIALEEVQDNNGTINDGTTSAATTLLQLIAAIDAAGGPHYTAIDAPPVNNADGGVSGGNIRPAYLYLADKVTPTAANNLTDVNGDGVYEFPQAQRIGNGNSDFTNVRKSVPIEWALNGDTTHAAGTLWTIDNHFTSKGGSAPLEGNTTDQPLYDEVNDNGSTKREGQAIALNAYVDGILASNPNAHIIALGDFNEYQFFPSIQLATGAIVRTSTGTSTTGGTYVTGTPVLQDMATTLPANEQYSYNFGGRAQELDHALLTVGDVASANFDIVHINSEFADQISDHDPSMTQISFNRSSAIATSGDDVLDQGAYTAKFGATLGSLTGADSIYAYGGNDTVHAGDGNDTVYGGDGFDVLYGEGGDDSLYGGADGDTLYGGAGVNLLDGGSGVDVADYGGETNAIAVDLAAGTASGADFTDTLVSIEAIYGGGAGDTISGNSNGNILVGNGGDDSLSGGAGGDLLSGGDGNDVIHGGDDGDTLYGGAGNDALYGEGGDDYIADSAGNDTIDGGAGFNILDYADATGAVTVNLGLTTAQNTGGGGIDTISNIQALRGSAFNDTLIGSSGNDSLDGAGGADTMKGGLGDDTYYVDNVGDVVTELLNQGNDQVITSLTSYTLGANVEGLAYTGSADFTGTGNALNNNILGGTGNDTLYGGVGNDRLDGAAGNDVIYGGAGADLMFGGAGNDTFYVDNVGDTAQESAGGGDDTVYSTVSYSIGVGNEIEHVILTGTSAANATGNEIANDLVGNSGKNVLNGGAGDDHMGGGAGDDTYVVDSAGDVVVENPGEGTDTVQTTLATYSLGDSLENLTFTGSGDFSGTGNALNNTIVSDGGNDHLDGGAGADTLRGGAGDDTYVVDNIGDKVVELAGAGHDAILTDLASITLVAEVEDLTYTGSAAFTGAGNASDNQITGGAQADSLSGKDGNDFLIGLDGNDSLSGGNGNDFLLGGMGADKLAGGAGADTFGYGSAAEGGDIITDFDTTMDHLQLSAAGFGISGVGDITFVSGVNPLASGAGPTLLYNTKTGAILWDHDGAGGDAAVLLATLSTHPAGFDLTDVVVGP